VFGRVCSLFISRWLVVNHTMSASQPSLLIIAVTGTVGGVKTEVTHTTLLSSMLVQQHCTLCNIHPSTCGRISGGVHSGLSRSLTYNMHCMERMSWLALTALSISLAACSIALVFVVAACLAEPFVVHGGLQSCMHVLTHARLYVPSAQFFCPCRLLSDELAHICGRGMPRLGSASSEMSGLLYNSQFQVNQPARARKCD